MYICIVNIEVLRSILCYRIRYKMGVLLSCCNKKTTETEYLTPSIETKRRQQAEAAERRLREQESRGIKDPEKYKQKIQKLEEIERKQEELAKACDPKLTWTVG